MNKSTVDRPVEVRVFGALRKHLDRQNLPCFIKKHVSSDSCIPADIAKELELPQNEIEAVFINGKVSDICTPLIPGDRLAFLPYGTPGPYRVYLGIVNRENE